VALVILLVAHLVGLVAVAVLGIQAALLELQVKVVMAVMVLWAISMLVVGVAVLVLLVGTHRGTHLLEMEVLVVQTQLRDLLLPVLAVVAAVKIVELAELAELAVVELAHRQSLE
jgi:hypothetical protein